MINCPVFFSEIELDVSNPGQSSRVFESFLAYYLLTDKLLIHPLYLWQSSVALQIFNKDFSSLITPNNVKFVLDDNESISDYVFNRIRILNSTENKYNITLNELGNYKRISKNEIIDYCNRLDRKFTKNSGSYNITSKDKRFRELILSDLRIKSYQGSSLYSLLWRIRSDNQISEKSLDQKVNMIINLIGDKNNLISCDTLKYYFINLGFDFRSLDFVNSRLRDLMVYSHYDGNVIVPSRLNKHAENDFFNTKIFLHVTNELIGDKIIQKLFGLKWTEQLGIIIELKNDDIFMKYIDNYFIAT